MIADRSVAGAAEAFWNAVEAFETRTDAQLAKRCPDKRCLHVPNRDALNALRDDCAAHPGGVPVYVKIDDENATLLLSRESWVAKEGDETGAFGAPTRNLSHRGLH